MVADIGVSMAGEDPTQRGGRSRGGRDHRGRAARPSPWPRASPPWPAGERIIGTGVERWGRIDGVVAVAGILRERMLFNMSEDEWDAVIETHLKGHFTVFRAASAVMRKQEGGGSLVAFTSGAFAGSVAQANYAAAKGGIVSLVRSAAAGLTPLRHHGQRHRPGGPDPDVGQRARWTWPRWATPRTWRPWSSTCCRDRAKHVTGQVYTSVGPKIAVWNQPREVRAMYADGRWTPEQIAERLDSTVGQERMPLLDQLEAYRKAAEEKAAAEKAAG